MTMMVVVVMVMVIVGVVMVMVMVTTTACSRTVECRSVAADLGPSPGPAGRSR